MTDVITRKVVANEADLNRDPITGTPGAHPLGTGAGAATGSVAGGVAGLAVGGPVGGVIGAAIGALAGGLAGKSAAESVNPTAEELFWKLRGERSVKSLFDRNVHIWDANAFQRYLQNNKSRLLVDSMLVNQCHQLGKILRRDADLARGKIFIRQ